MLMLRHQVGREQLECVSFVLVSPGILISALGGDAGAELERRGFLRPERGTWGGFWCLFDVIGRMRLLFI